MALGWSEIRKEIIFMDSGASEPVREATSDDVPLASTSVESDPSGRFVRVRNYV